jgi:hypothetical protein
MPASSTSTRRFLGDDHPLTRVEESLASVRNQALVCLALIAGSPAVLLAGRDTWAATVGSALVVEVGAGVAILALRSLRRQRIHDMIVAGNVPDLEVVRAEVRRLQSDDHRRWLASALEKALADGERWHEFTPAARPPLGVRNLPAHASAIREIARDLRDHGASVRAIVMVERLAAGGYGSALYEADQAWLGRELTRIRYELQARPELQAPLRHAA